MSVQNNQVVTLHVERHPFSRARAQHDLDPGAAAGGHMGVCPMDFYFDKNPTLRRGGELFYRGFFDGHTHAAGLQRCGLLRAHDAADFAAADFYSLFGFSLKGP